MQTYSEFLNESFKNLFKLVDKKVWADEVWKLLQTAYSDIGGLKGSGFETKENMISKIPFWKLNVRDGVLLAVIMYKDKGGRKSVVTAHNKTRDGSRALKAMTKDEFGRSMSERSGDLLRFTIKNFPDLVKKFSIPAVKVSKIIGKEIELIPGEKFKYLRVIGGSKQEKMLIGTPGKSIVDTTN